ncbi:hypothetical protein PHLCEN_2v4384 [Hermanssonia centrifuga]|uniref:Uncharacterized protein n=1 Tax=Hermanssonia centrifuga TaxID=98765 RepID=A0A2R6PVM7_9APHY|nr:hypothetical protein PHLCEN_2v4384 [Hermanssonia centrifuga]
MHLMWMHNCISGILRRRKTSKTAVAVSQQPPPSSDTRPAPLHRIPSYLLSRPLVTSTLDIMRARRIASSTLLRRSRQEMLRLLHDALREVDVGSDVVASDVEFPQAASDLQQSLAAYVSPAPRFRSIRRRVVGRIRRSLPDAVQVAEVVDHYIDPVVSD